MTRAIAWFRADLRVGDNPAWAAATEGHELVTALFVIDPRPMEAAGPLRRGVLAGHLAALDRSLAKRAGRLRVERGDPVVIPSRSSITPRRARRRSRHTGRLSVAR